MKRGVSAPPIASHQYHSQLCSSLKPALLRPYWGSQIPDWGGLSIVQTHHATICSHSVLSFTEGQVEGDRTALHKYPPASFIQCHSTPPIAVGSASLGVRSRCAAMCQRLRLPCHVDSFLDSHLLSAGASPAKDLRNEPVWPWE